MLTFRQKIQLPKTCEKRFYKHIKVVLSKRQLEKAANIRKTRAFLKWPQCKGYSPCKILKLGQKIKLPKTCDKCFYKHIKVVLCKRQLEKAANIRKTRAFLKWPQCKGYSPYKILSLGQKMKLPKTCEKRFYKHIKVVLCKKRLQKGANIRKMRAF